MARGSRDIASAVALLILCPFTPSLRADLLEIRGQLLTGDAWLDAARPTQPVARARTDEAGRFRLLAPAPGFWEVAARSPGRLEMRLPLAPLLDDRRCLGLAISARAARGQGPNAPARPAARH